MRFLQRSDLRQIARSNSRRLIEIKADGAADEKFSTVLNGPDPIPCHKG